MDEAIKNANNACEEKLKEAKKQKTPNRRGLNCTVPASGLVWSWGREVGIYKQIWKLLEFFSSGLSSHSCTVFLWSWVGPKSNNRDHQAGRHSTLHLFCVLFNLLTNIFYFFKTFVNQTNCQGLPDLPLFNKRGCFAQWKAGQCRSDQLLCKWCFLIQISFTNSLVSQSLGLTPTRL